MIKLTNITKKYKRKTALKNIDLEFPSRGMIFVCGESGSGKSTLLNIIGGLDIPTDGTYLFNDVDITKTKNKDKDIFRNNNIGIVFQDINLLEELTLAQNIQMPIWLQGKKTDQIDLNNELLKINLNESLDDYPSNLSGGERQRIAILRATNKDSKVIIADEPTGSLDRKNANLVMKQLKEISKERLVIVVTHQEELADIYGDRVIMMEKGMIVDDRLINALEETPLILNKTTKSKLPLKIASQIAFKWFKFRPVKLVISLLTMCIAITALIVSANIFIFNETDALKAALKTEDLSHFRVQKRFVIDPQDDHTNYFSLEDEAKIDSVYDSDEVIKVIFDIGLARSIPYHDYNEQQDGFAIINDEIIKNFNFKLYGKVPSDTAAEVVITTFQAHRLNWLSTDNFNDESTIISLVGRELTLYVGNDGPLYNSQGDVINKVVLTVSGILDTKYKLPDTTKMIEDQTYRQIETQRLAYEAHRVFYFAQPSFEQIRDFNIQIGNITENVIFNICFVSVLGNKLHKIDELLSLYEDNDLIISHRLEASLARLSESQGFFSQIILVVAIIFLVISGLVFINFIQGLVLDKIDSVQILRSLGMSFVSMSKIFVIQTSIITAIVIAVSSVASIIIGNVINTTVQGGIRIAIPLFIYRLEVLFAAIIFLFALSSLIFLLQLIKTYNQNKVVKR